METTSFASSSSSSSSSSPPAKRFDVFLSFRGEDTRNNFTGHLSLALHQIGLFNIFKDDYTLQKGKDIGPELMKAIEDSQYAVVVLSENYATSSWCLKELAKIVECMGDSGRIRTIFYNVNPSHVRNVILSDVKKQEESSFWKALEEHAKNPSHSIDLESWRNALFKVANQSGHPIEAHTDEAIFIKDFVADISSELGALLRTINGIFGMTSRLNQFHSYVLESLDTKNVCFIGFHGMGGIGKSTLAYYKKMSRELKFDGSSFLQNVREVCEKKENGLVHLQKQLLSDILEDNFAKVRYVDDGIDMIRSRLRHKKVLIVLDDVNKLDQLNGLVGEDTWFGFGSIILVTTREDSFLKIKSYAIYRAESLNPSEALQLFSSKAFGSIKPPKEYKELFKLVVEYASYLPLALTVLGSLLGGKNTSEWESALRRLRNCPEKEIVEKLKISFNDLNEDDQHIFLDIACFFNGFDKEGVTEILDACGFEPLIAISNLVDKSLLSIQDDSTLWVHDLLQEMGKEIVRKESGSELRRQSRTWDEVDFYNILENQEGTNEVVAIMTPVDPTKEYSFEALSSMKKLRLLMIGLVDYDERLAGKDRYLVDCDGPELSNNLLCMCWVGFPYNKLSSSFRSHKLVRLDLPYSNIEQLWNNRIKSLYNLKSIDLSHSLSFTKFDDFTVVPNLKALILNHYEKLSEIHHSIKHLKKFILLELKFCTGLEKLPEEIFLMENLEKVYVPRNEMIESAVKENIISYWATGKCFFPGWFRTSLRSLDLSDCNLTGPKAFPEYFGKLASLKELNLSKNPFSVLPPVINGLSRLTTLRLENCKNLRCLEAELLPSTLQLVSVSYCTSLGSFLDPLKPCHLRCSAHCLDCTELVRRQDGKMTALASLSRFLEDPSKRRDQAFQFVVPQIDDELPSWFVNQSSSASVSFKLDPNWRDSSLFGVAIAFCFRAYYYGKLSFFCTIKVNGRKKLETTMEVGVTEITREVGVIETTMEVDATESGMSDHLFLFYSKLDRIKQLEPPSCDTLEFSFCGDGDECGSSYGPFGVRLVSYKDMRELKEITSKCNNYQRDVQSSH